MLKDPAPLRDWLFAKPSKRLLLEALLLSERGRPWRRAELASASGLHPKARMDLHLEPLLACGLLARHGSLYVVTGENGIAETLGRLLEELQSAGSGVT